MMAFGWTSHGNVKRFSSGGCAALLDTFSGHCALQKGLDDPMHFKLLSLYFSQ